jgi:hypothetical protein
MVSVFYAGWYRPWDQISAIPIITGLVTAWLVLCGRNLEKTTGGHNEAYGAAAHSLHLRHALYDTFWTDYQDSRWRGFVHYCHIPSDLHGSSKRHSVILLFLLFKIIRSVVTGKFPRTGHAFKEAGLGHHS